MENKRFLRGFWRWFGGLSGFKKSVLIFLIVLGYLMVRLPVTFRVLDAETGKPIEGAVAIAMWTGSKGVLGLSYSYTAVAIEAVSDENGKLRFPFLFGRAGFFKPHVKVYKAGYVGWDSVYIYLGCYQNNLMIPKAESRENFVMKDQNIFLEHWKDEYTYISHYVHIVTPPDIHKVMNNSKYLEAIWSEAVYREREREVKR